MKTGLVIASEPATASNRGMVRYYIGRPHVEITWHLVALGKERYQLAVASTGEVFSALEVEGLLGDVDLELCPVKP